MNLVGQGFGFRLPFFVCVLSALSTGACNIWARGVWAPIRFESHVGLLPLAAPPPAEGSGIVPYRGSGDAAPASTTACTLQYYGGPLVSNIQIVPVIWGSNVNVAITTNIAQFYSDAIVSNWYDLFSEYAASTSGTTTNQSIGRGSATAAITITPAKCPSAANCSMTDADLQNEIKAQITGGILPSPQFDGAGYTNTAYMVHFPPNVTLTRNTSVSCVQFCAYHSTALFGADNKPLLYAAVMDQFTSTCVGGCGAGANHLSDETSVAAHQVAEIATDPDVGLVTVFAAPLAWYAPSGCSPNGEIADICNGQQGTITVSGRTWTVQKQWSNHFGACVTTYAHPHYAVSAPATTPAGTAFSFDVTAQNPYTNTDIAYVGTVHFSSSDPGAVLPADFTFVPEDLGTASLMATLTTQGLQTITATDTLNNAIVGTSAMINVTKAADGTALSTACATTFVENQAIMLTATVTNGVNPTGSVTFADGPTVFCSNVTLTSGAADCHTAALTVQGGGTSSVYQPVASYGGDSANNPSASSPLPLTVLAASDVIFRASLEAVVVGCPAN